jgi:diguanylate cyclase (GGDEF)-like protein/PAS domain S-box-containing protein
MRSRLNSIRFLIPFITIVILVVSIGIAYAASRGLSYQHVDEDMQINIRNKLNYLQGSTEQLMNAGMRDTLYQVVSSIASEPDLISVLVVDQDDRVLASNNFSEAGSIWRGLSISLDENLIETVTRSKKTLLRHDHDKDHMEGYVSVCIENESRSLRSGKCGFAFYRVDLAYHYSVSEQALNLQTLFFTLGISVTVIAMLTLLHFWLNQPTHQITSALSRFNRGDRDQRIKVWNSNEISFISRAINKVLDTVVEDENALQDREQRLRAIFDNTIDSVITVDRWGIIQTVNPATQRLLGYSDSELLGKNISIITPEPHRSKHDGYLQRYLDSGEQDIIGETRELKAQTKNGDLLPIALTVSEMLINGERCFTGIIRDISEQLKLREAMSKANNELRSSNQLLQKKSRTDPLTGIANRGSFDETLETELRRGARKGETLSLLMIDVDYFKLYNDFYGHPMGDKCLQRIAETMKDGFQRSGELPARYGGEEFAVILPGIDAQRALELADGLCESIRQLDMPHEKSLVSDRITISVGIVTLRAVSKGLFSADELVNAADKSLYQAKESGRDGVCATILSNGHLQAVMR